MRICEFCKTESKSEFCPNCGLLTVPKPEKKGKVSTVIGLIFMVFFDIIAMALLVYAFFRDIDATALENAVEMINSAGALMLLGLWFLGFSKWIAFAVPKTFKVAKGIIRSIIPLTLFAFAVEAMVCIWLTLIPVSIFSITLMPLALLIKFMESQPTNIFAAVVIFVLACLATYYFGKKVIVKSFGKSELEES